MKTLQQINEQLVQQQKQNHLFVGLTWLSLQYSLGKITKKEYKVALKQAKKYKRSI